MLNFASMAIDSRCVIWWLLRPREDRLKLFNQNRINEIRANVKVQTQVYWVRGFDNSGDVGSKFRPGDGKHPNNRLLTADDVPLILIPINQAVKDGIIISARDFNESNLMLTDEEMAIVRAGKI